jgi:hypothetical protein
MTSSCSSLSICLNNGFWLLLTHNLPKINTLKIFFSITPPCQTWTNIKPCHFPISIFSTHWLLHVKLPWNEDSKHNVAQIQGIKISAWHKLDGGICLPCYVQHLQSWNVKLIHLISCQDYLISLPFILRDNTLYHKSSPFTNIRACSQLKE